LLCRLNLHHKWVRRFNADGEDYFSCRACGKDRYDVEGIGPNIGSLRLLASKRSRGGGAGGGMSS
jgi:hypothetical protein